MPCAAGCTTNSPYGLGGLEITIAADGLTAPADFDDIRLIVDGQAGDAGWNQLWREDYAVPSPGVTLPTTFAIVAGKSPDEEVLITVAALKKGVPIVLDQAQVQVPMDHVGQLRMVLAIACEGQIVVMDPTGDARSSCPVGQTCSPDTGQCVPLVSGDVAVDASGQDAPDEDVASGQDGTFVQGDEAGVDATATAADALAASDSETSAVDGTTAEADATASPVDASTTASDSATCATSSCAAGLVCERYAGTACVDPSWAQWPMPNAPIDVAAGAPNGDSYTDGGDGTVTDNVTGLVWQQAVPATSYNQAGAGAYCAALSLGGFTGWRLPSLVELVSIVDPGGLGPTIDSVYFPNTPSDAFWSSTQVAEPPAGNGWDVYFASGYTAILGVNYVARVRCVR